ncbi:MAG: DUF6122 family protein [Salinimicrobium sp.]
MLQTLVHYSLHLLFPALIAWWYDKKQWKRNYLILLATMLVDLDHLLANPVFHPNRCSIGFHVFHSEYLIPLYFVGAFLLRKSWLKLVLIGLAFHMFTDLVDCLWMASECDGCPLSEIFKGL